MALKPTIETFSIKKHKDDVPIYWKRIIGIQGNKKAYCTVANHLAPILPKNSLDFLYHISSGVAVPERFGFLSLELLPPQIYVPEAGQCMHRYCPIISPCAATDGGPPLSDYL